MDEIEHARSATGHLDGGQELGDDPLRDGMELACGGRVGVGEHDRHPRIAVPRHRRLDGHGADQRRARQRGEALATARAEDRVVRTVGRDELGHVLDHAQYLQIRAASHVGNAGSHLLGTERRRRHDEHLGLRQQARQRHLDVTGSRGHVDQQVVEITPADVDEELLQRLGEDETAPHERDVLVVDEQSHRHDAQPAGTDRHLVGCDLAFAVRRRRTREPALHAEHPRDGEAPDVGVEDADGEAARRERGREVRGDRRLADAALAAPDGDDPRRRGDLRGGRRL